MFLEAQQQNENRTDAGACSRSAAERSPVVAAHAEDPGTSFSSQDVSIGHLLPKGHMSVHSPGQPCRYCDEGQASQPSPSQPSPSPAPARRGGLRHRMRSFLSATAVLATAMAAYSTAYGGGAASAATAGRAAAAAPAVASAAGVTWHKLTLVNGWKSDQDVFSSGNPSWAVKNGIVYLSGSMRQQVGGTSNVFAVLPAAARPTHTLYLLTFTYDWYGYLTIFPSGEMAAFSTPQDIAQGYTSLAGVSFPAADTASHQLGLLNGWQSSQSQWSTGDPAYTVSHGMVYLSGSLHGGGSTLAAVLPSAARPAHYLLIAIYTFDGNPGTLAILPNGKMFLFGTDAASFTSLAAVSYPVAATKIHKLALLHGWQSTQSSVNSGDPSYSVAGGIVHLSGGLRQPAGGNKIFAKLPPAARPAHFMWIPVYNDGGAVGYIMINTFGTMEAFSISGKTAQAYTSLAGISYPLKS